MLLTITPWLFTLESTICEDLGLNFEHKLGWQKNPFKSSGEPQFLLSSHANCLDPEIECDNRSVTHGGGKQGDNEELVSLGMLTAWMVLCPFREVLWYAPMGIH